MNWTHPKRLIVDKNDFGTIEGQGLTNVYLQHNNKLCNMHSYSNYSSNYGNMINGLTFFYARVAIV